MGLLTALGGLAGFALGGPTGAKLGASLGGALDSSRNASRERSTSLSDQKNQFVRLREAALKGGFNPLTVLQSTGGAGFVPSSGVPSAASTDSLVNGIRDAAESYAFDTDPMRQVEVENGRLRNDLARLQIETLSDVPRAARVPVGSTVSVSSSVPDVRVVGSPAWQGHIATILSNGQAVGSLEPDISASNSGTLFNTQPAVASRQVVVTELGNEAAIPNTGMEAEDVLFSWGLEKFIDAAAALKSNAQNPESVGMAVLQLPANVLSNGITRFGQIGNWAARASGFSAVTDAIMLPRVIKEVGSHILPIFGGTPITNPDNRLPAFIPTGPNGVYDRGNSTVTPLNFPSLR